MAAIVSRARNSIAGDVLMPPDGLVKLKDKRVPVVEQVAEDRLDPEARPMVFTRGRVDVSLLQHLLSSKGDAVWTDEEHARSNVKLTRPAHDRWGIGKIVFVYSDDFLKKVYTFPWFHDPEWRQALQPVLDVLGIPEGKVMRCLLASMPPGCVIPVHHDTGLWVQHTHRIHVAVTTDVAEVDFFVGADVDNMRKVMMDEGRVVELNNQAKHAVTNGWSRNRVHLILDYVEDYPLDVVRLSPGTKLVQTRRSIDVKGVSKREGPDPAFIIIGGQKCGTTLLYECLNQHPLVARGGRRETHFFDWTWQPRLKTVQQQRDFYMRFFDRERLERHPSIVTGESTPSYLLRGWRWMDEQDLRASRGRGGGGAGCSRRGCHDVPERVREGLPRLTAERIRRAQPAGTRAVRSPAAAVA
uniref:Sulfotransferase n=1 Tax=Saccharina japonica TaxID=88149 RepID=A0A6G6CDK9_SACJA|nr:sulfotransferase [Saccharina japonica]